MLDKLPCVKYFTHRMKLGGKTGAGKRAMLAANSMKRAAMATRNQELRFAASIYTTAMAAAAKHEEAKERGGR